MISDQDTLGTLALCVIGASVAFMIFELFWASQEGRLASNVVWLICVGCWAAAIIYLAFRHARF